MTSKAWFNTDHQLTPGREIFRSDRWFQMSAYTASHSQLLLRSTTGPDLQDQEHETTIDLLFKPIYAVKIRNSYTGLVIRCATDEEAERVKASIPGIRLRSDERVFLLESRGETDYIISMAIGWHEGVLRPTQHSFFNDADAYLPRWPTQPLFGVSAGFNVASAEELIEALSTDTDQPLRRDRYRLVHVLMTRVDLQDEPEVTGAGVFLTRADAEDAQAQLAPKVADCWIETLPIAI
jgi:hypothetical protein